MTVDEMVKEQIDLVWEEQILDKNPLATPQKNPIGFVLGGQPGAGKSNLIDKIRKEQGKNVIVINGDDFRKYHPDYANLQISNQLDMPKHTAEFAGKMVETILEKAIKERYNVVIEGTFRTAETPINTLQKFKNNGYQTEVLIQTADPSFSYASCEKRYEDARKKDPSQARFTEKAHHDLVCQNLAQNIQTVQESGLTDNLRIYIRNRQNNIIELFDSRHAQKEFSQKELEELNVLLKRSQSELTNEQIAELQKEYKLTDKEEEIAFNEAWNKMINPNPIDYGVEKNFIITPSQNPKGYIIGGQSGSGKSTARKQFISENPESKNSVILDVDEIIKTHPQYPKIESIYKDKAYDILYPFYSPLFKKLQEKALNEGYNIFLESTFSNTDKPKRMLDALRKAGYKTEVLLVACDKEISWDSCIEREKRTDRAITKDYHDKIVANYSSNARAVQETGLVDNLRIIKRQENGTFNTIYNSPELFDTKMVDNILNESENKRKAMTNNDDISINHKAFITKIDVDRTEENLKTEKTIEEIQKNLNRDNKPTNIITNEQKDDNNEKYGNTHKMKI